VKKQDKNIKKHKRDSKCLDPQPPLDVGYHNGNLISNNFGVQHIFI